MIRCSKCGSNSYEEKLHELHGAGAWCNSCGRFIKWIGKHRTAEEQAVREETKNLYKLEAMSCQDPTEQQLAYLKKLKYQGFIGSRLHAYNLIQQMAGD